MFHHHDEHPNQQLQLFIINSLYLEGYLLWHKYFAAIATLLYTQNPFIVFLAPEWCPGGLTAAKPEDHLFEIIF